MISEIKVRMGRTISNPYRSYSNLRFDVELTERIGIELSEAGRLKAQRWLLDDAMTALNEQEVALIKEEFLRHIHEEPIGWGRPNCATCGHRRDAHGGEGTPFDAGHCLIQGCPCTTCTALVEKPLGQCDGSDEEGEDQGKDPLRQEDPC